jgi:hypothetical protein
LTAPVKLNGSSWLKSDAERDRLVAALQQAGVVQSVEWMDGFHAELEPIW